MASSYQLPVAGESPAASRVAPPRRPKPTWP